MFRFFQQVFFLLIGKRCILPSENLSLLLCHSGPRIQHSKRPSITFPLARPTTDNIFAICDYSNCRPRYTKDMLPRNGFGYVHRQASAVNRLESWFTVCCSHDTQDEELTLCCAQQAVRTQADCWHMIPYNLYSVIHVL